jgi:hypothetical protein
MTNWQQHQIVSPKIFDKIVRDEIKRKFSIEYLIDQRLPKLYERIPEKELKNEVYSIFFKSFDDILESIGVGKKEKLKIRMYWYDTCDVVNWYLIIPEIYSRMGFKEEDKKDIKFDFPLIHLYFSHQKKKYVMRLTSRIEEIVNYLFTKNIICPTLQASRGMKYKPIEERRHGNVIEWDMYGLMKVMGESISRDLKSSERNIWQPRLIPELKDKNTIRIGFV